jgi:hypothetical protein
MAATKKTTKKSTAKKCGPGKCATSKATSKKKVTAKKATAKKGPIKAKTGKKTNTPTATEQVLKVIKRFKKGVSVPAIRERTGLEDKQIRNIVTRAHKQGKIKRVDRGLYAGA